MSSNQRKYYQTLYTKQLINEVQSLTERLAAAKHVLDNRSDTPSTSWRCGECDFVDENADVVVNHMMDVHNYPEEDAGLSTECFFV